VRTVTSILAIALCAVATGVGQTSTRRSLLVDDAYVDRVRAQIATGDSGLKTALDTLEKDAAVALARKPVSVMDKGLAPPSGDKHDYMSQAPYWWPDPSKPDGRPYIRKDGVTNPEIRRITDHDNLGRLCSDVAMLGLAYRLTRKPEHAAHAAQLARVWFLDPATRMNPHLKFGQGIPGINDGRGIGIIETRGLPDLLDGLALVGDSRAWTAGDEAGLQAWMQAFLTWLVESDYGKDESKNGNNHETWYDVQVAALSYYTGQTDITRRTIEHARDAIAAQIQPDGRQPRELERTKSWDYSAFNLRAFFNLATIGERIGVDLWNYQTADGRGLRKALDYMVGVAAGDRPWTYEQIGGVRNSEIQWLLRKAAVAWKSNEYSKLAMRQASGISRIDLTLPTFVP